MAGEDRKSVQNFASRHGFVAIDWPAIPYDPFFNINTPDDIAEAEKLAGKEDAAGAIFNKLADDPSARFLGLL